MSEYIDIHVDYDDDPDVARLTTNLDLAPDGPESYPDRAAGDEGSPLAQYLFGIEGLAALDIDGSVLVVRREPESEWHALIDEISAALKEFFL
ncbi:MAG: NifU N-terminal domain-containing protein [Anaerolineae bacterium]|nr:NifU N-terminal domain-containing protein [Anaerolineae bacterium]